MREAPEDLKIAYWRLNKALSDIIDMCPKSNPGPSRDIYGWVEEGNGDEVAYSCRDEALWKVAEVAAVALYEGAVLADYEIHEDRQP